LGEAEWATTSITLRAEEELGELFEAHGLAASARASSASRARASSALRCAIGTRPASSPSVRSAWARASAARSRLDSVLLTQVRDRTTLGSQTFELDRKGMEGI
jgi:hypothetical protein